MLVDFTKDELIALSQLLDLSVKAGGLSVAEAAVVLNKRINSTLLPQKEEAVSA